MKRLPFYLVIAATISFFWFMYQQKQVVQDVKIEQIALAPYSLKGRSFKGLSNSQTLKERITQLYLLKDKAQISQPVEVHFMGNPDQFEEEIRVFVGLPATELQLPDSLEDYQFPGGTALVAEVRTDKLVKANPAEINEKLLLANGELPENTQPYFIEKYLGDTVVVNYLLLSGQ